MLHDWRARSRVSRQRPDVAVAALVQDPIAHNELIASALFGSCCGSCRVRPATRQAPQDTPEPAGSRWRPLLVSQKTYAAGVEIHCPCTRPQAERQILLATRASSTHDPEPTSASVKLSALPQLMEYEVLIQLRLPHSMDSCVHDSFFGRFQRGKLFDDLTLPRNKDPIR
jgi:hypothetical protein